MKLPYFLFIGFCSLMGMNIYAQEPLKELKLFVGGNSLISKSGSGLTQTSGDILLELSSNESDENEQLVILRKINGNLKKITENRNLLVNKELLGISGGNYPELSDNKLSVDYTLGSNSAVSDISILFEKNSDGNYYFKEYTSVTLNYGVENLFARQKITAQQTGKISFEETSESTLFKSSKTNPFPVDTNEPVYKASERFSKYIPEGWHLATFAQGDLNLDGLKKDLLFILYNAESCRIQLLLQQNNGIYKAARTNTNLITPDEKFNINNLKAVIKNGYFSIEQRIATDDTNFDHRYSTFKYDAAQKNWLLYRYDVEHFSGFSPKPKMNVIHLTQQNFGKILFEKLDYTPGDYYYEPAISTISGTLLQKQFYGPPYYGETPKIDEKILVYILKSTYPVNIFGALGQPDQEISDKTILGVTEIQVYTSGNNLDLSKCLHKEIKLKGTFMQMQTGRHYTPIVMLVKEVVD